MTTFDALGLSAPLIQLIEAQGFTEPTAIQTEAIPLLLEGRDMMGTAQTGEGKTAAYLLPVLHRLTQEGEATAAPIPRKPLVLILAPTRELASQIGEALRQFSKGMRLYYTVIYGGTRFATQQKVMERGVQILVATPGRLMDHHRRGTVRLDKITTFILDEADRMLDMGFVDEVKEVAKIIPAAHQTIMFSATMNKGVRGLAATLLHNPAQIDVGKANSVATNVDHRVMRVRYPDKKPLLMHLLGREDVKRVLIFTRTKAMADTLTKDIVDAGHSADAIHGDREQSVRQQVLKDFRNGTTNILVATDVAARGIDVPDITHVINFDMPVEADGYVHRVGRTGRAGAKGTALSICTSGEGNLLRLVEQVIGQKVPVDADHPFHDASAATARGGYDSLKPKRSFSKNTGPRHRKGADGDTPRSSYVRSEHPARAERAPGAERSFKKSDKPYRKDAAPFEKKERPSFKKREDGDRPSRPARSFDPAFKANREERKPYPRDEAGAPFEKKERLSFNKRDDAEQPAREERGFDPASRPHREERKSYPRDEAGGSSEKKDRPPFKKRDGDKPFRREDGGAPYKKKEGASFKKRDGGDKPFRQDRGFDPAAKPNRDGGKPFRRDEGAASFKKKEGGASFKKREGGDKPFREDRAFDPAAKKPHRKGGGAFKREDGGQASKGLSSKGQPFKGKPFTKKEGASHDRPARSDVPQKKRADVGKKRTGSFTTATRSAERPEGERNGGGFKPRTRRPS